MRMTQRLVFAVVYLVLAACSGNERDPDLTTGPGTESKLVLVLSAQTDTIPESTSKQLTARVTDQTGFPKLATVSWLSTNPSIATVNNGLVTGVSQGTASVIASTTGAADTALIVVTENDMTLDVQPSAATVALGDTINFEATLRTRAGDIIRVNSFSWSVSDTSAAQFVGVGSMHTKREADVEVSAEAMQRQGNSTVKIFRSPVASVTISPSTTNVYKGSSTTLAVTLRDRNGRLIEDEVKWGSSDYTKATVSQDGTVTGVGSGTVVITATADSKTGSATVNVLSPPAAAIELSLPSTTLLVGVEMQATVIATDAAGDSLFGKTVGWQSANPSIATVTSAGKVKGIGEGTVSISAIVDGVIATERLSVKGRTPTSIAIVPGAPSVNTGQQSQLVARIYDENGGEITGQPVSWASSNTAVATISASGLLQGISTGSSVVTVSSGTLTASVTASVVNVPVASVRVSPTSALLASAGAQTTLVAEALDANQNVLAGRAVTWSSQNPIVATVTNGGVVTAIGSGSTTVTATIEGKSASVPVGVNAPPPAPVASVAVTLASPTLKVGGETRATAVLTDAAGHVLTGRAILWFSLDTAVAKVNASGLVTAHAGGTVAIMARIENISGSASLTVSAPSFASVSKVTLSVPTSDLKQGEEVQTVVTAYDSAGSVLTDRTILYTTENPAVVTVSATGMVKAMGGGSAKVKASSGGATATETFRVTAPQAVTSILVSPATSTLNVGGTTQATAVAEDAQGTSMTGVSFAWTTSNSSVATVSPSGLITAVSAGTATIHAASSGCTGSMTVTVSPNAPSTATVASVQVTLSSTNILVGGTSQASAVARDAQGTVISGRTVSWSLGGSLLATVSSSGLVSGVAAGVVPVTATVDGVSGSASLTISAQLPPPPTSAIVELPQTYLNFLFPSKTGQTIVVPPGGNLQTAINNAQRGDEIVLSAGATYSGNFTLPAKSGTSANGWIVIRSDKLNQLPGMGSRVSPTDASLMPKIESPNTAPALKTVGAASGWWLAGLEVTVSASVTAVQYGLINLGDGGSGQTSLASVASDLVLDRVYVHGQAKTNLIRCIALNSARSQVSDSYVAECHAKGYDSQAIWGGNGPGPFKIVNNMLMGAGENVMFGGNDPSIPGLVPSDIEIRRNYVYTPVAWKGVWTRKNLLELKNARRVLIEENVFDGSWLDAQTGWAIILKSANQSGGCSWCRTTDVTFRRNLIRNAGAGINVVPRGDNPDTDTTARRILISEVVLENIGVSPYTGDARGFQLLGGTAYVTVERSVLAGSLSAAVMLEKNGGSAYAVFRDNVLQRGQYGVIATGTAPGTTSLNAGAPGWTWTNMTLVGAAQTGYPTGTTWVSSENLAPLATQLRSIVSQAVSGVMIP